MKKPNLSVDAPRQLNNEPATLPSPEMLTLKQVASLLVLSTMTVYRMVKEARIPYHQIGKSIRVRKSDLEEYLSRSKYAGS